ncbi:hypothetical protein GTP91_17995 [Rugamonas sp. FT82W]|uniref:Uncharacterized protein n=1 Tax=Duganella vulcania TaxID=2692166 RepID=A0A845G7E3_9BURK|nr:hypothetical protein [Duganella vulcania]MYM89056.1 hypothetical protein [Duganella vulcania]
MTAAITRFIGLLVMIPLVTIGWLAGIQFLSISPLWKSPEWVSAIGTLLAFAGTIWLAQSSSRQQKRLAEDRAIIAAAGLFVRVETASSSVSRVVQLIKVSSRPGINRTLPFLDLASHLMHLDLWTDEEVLPLIVLPNRVAARMAVIRSKILQCSGVMSSWVPKDTSQTIDEQSVQEMLFYALRLVDESLKIVLSELGPLAGQLHVIQIAGEPALQTGSPQDG